MRTRKMNVRITFFKKVGEQNEDGEVLTFKKKCLYTCWAEVSKTIFVKMQPQRKQVDCLNIKILKRF